MPQISPEHEALILNKASFSVHFASVQEAMNSYIHLPRLYLTPSPQQPAGAGAQFFLDPAQARYLGTVLRKKSGDSLRVFNAEAGEWRAVISTLNKDKGSFVLEEQMHPPHTQPERTLVFALLKRDATDLVIRMGTELGVTHFQPVITERTNTHRANTDRLNSIAREAAEQCERLDLPLVAEPCPLTSLLASWPSDKNLFAAIERTEDRAPGASLQLTAARAGDGLLIGPEGGLSDAECQMLLGRTFVTPVSLGKLVLRADTAVVSGLTLMSTLLRSAQDQSL